MIIGLHGMNDYSAAFEEPGAYWASQGIATYAFDQRGFGENAQAIGIWAGQANMRRDVAAAVMAAQAQHPGAPVYLLGVSMGGAVAALSLTGEDAPPVAGAVFVAPALWGGVYMDVFSRATIWLLAHTVPGKEFTGEGLKIQASDNIPMLQSLSADPLFLKATRTDAIYGLVNAMDDAYLAMEAGEVDVPVLMLYGRHDQVIPPEPILAVAETLPPHQQFVVYDEGWHMLLRDLQRKRVWDDVVAWVRATP